MAGVYGLIAVLTGAGGSFAQLSMYMYSVLALVALAWGLRAVKEVSPFYSLFPLDHSYPSVHQEDPKQTLYFAHLFFADHILSTAWTVFFAVIWWVYTPHDGQRTVNSAAQEEMAAKGGTGGSRNMTEQERVVAARMIWDKEKGTAAGIIVLSWLAKVRRYCHIFVSRVFEVGRTDSCCFIFIFEQQIYFALLIYSYATHLRKGSYRSLLHSRPTATNVSSSAFEASTIPDEDEDIEDFYRVPLRTPQTGGTTGSFKDFVSAPPASGKGRGEKSSLRQVIDGVGAEGGEVLFDNDIGVRAGAEGEVGVKDAERGLGGGS